jgi:hypothetical protein
MDLDQAKGGCLLVKRGLLVESPLDGQALSKRFNWSEETWLRVVLNLTKSLVDTVSQTVDLNLR